MLANNKLLLANRNDFWTYFRFSLITNKYAALKIDWNDIELEKFEIDTPVYLTSDLIIIIELYYVAAAGFILTRNDFSQEIDNDDDVNGNTLTKIKFLKPRQRDCSWSKQRKWLNWHEIELTDEYGRK